MGLRNLMKKNSFCNHYIKLSQYIMYGESYLEILLTGHLFPFTDVKNNL